MDKEIAKLSHVYRLFNSTEKVIIPFLNNNNFKKAINIDKFPYGSILEEKIFAMSFTACYYDFFMYNVEKSTPILHKNGIEYNNAELRCYSIDSNIFNYSKIDNISAFIPSYLLHEVYYSDKMIEGVEVDSSMIGWKYPPKKYYPEAYIKDKEPEFYDEILNTINEKKIDIDDFSECLKVFANKYSIPVNIEYRLKTIEGVYSLLKRGIPNLNLYNIHDINGIRIITKNIDDSYCLLEVIHNEFLPLDIFFDHIGVPKSNGFQCLMLRPEDKSLSLDIHIQTPLMKERAEHGSASNYRKKYDIK
jgi:hypothetical protein